MLSEWFNSNCTVQLLETIIWNSNQGLNPDLNKMAAAAIPRRLVRIEIKCNFLWLTTWLTYFVTFVCQIPLTKGASQNWMVTTVWHGNRKPTDWIAGGRNCVVFHVTVVPSHEAIAIILPIYLKLLSQFFKKLHLHRILLNEKSQIQYMDWVIFPLLYLS